MLIFKEMTENLNVIHLVYGDETELQLDMAGHLVIDLDDKLEKDKKNVLYINRCRNEEVVTDNLDLIMSHMGAIRPPASNPIQSPNTSDVSHKHPFKKSNKSPLPKINKDVKCTKCLEYGCIVVDGIPGLCVSCDMIENGLDNLSQPSVQLDDKTVDMINKLNESIRKNKLKKKSKVKKEKKGKKEKSNE